MNDLAIILQARTGSTRLPHKMLLDFYNGKTILELLLERISQKIKEIRIIVATTTTQQDNDIANLCDKLHISCFRGSENDVLERFICAAQAVKATKIIRICADNLFLDLDNLESLINHFTSTDLDYMSFITSTGIPSIKTHYGLWTEAVSLAALMKIRDKTSEKLYHEHVTNYIYTHQEDFKIDFIPIDLEVERHTSLRLTLDTAEDFQIQQEIYSSLLSSNQELTPTNILSYLDLHPLFYEIMNKTIKENSK